MDLHRYRQTSRKKGGQFSGPCWFTGQGTNRFTIEPFNPLGPVWFCRECTSSCSYGTPGRKGYRYGMFKEDDTPVVTQKPQKTPHPVIDITMATKFAESMNREGVAYLEGRGINRATIAKFKLGMSANRLITIPLTYTWHGQLQCTAIKMRWLPQYLPEGQSRFRAMAGSQVKGIFNFDALKRDSPFGIIGNSIFDIMLLDQLGFPCVGPYAGEAAWDAEWSKFFKWEVIINLGDWDDEKVSEDGTKRRAGTEYMLQRALKLADAPVLRKIINAFPPDGHQDITDAWCAGVDLKTWIISLLAEETGRT